MAPANGAPAEATVTAPDLSQELQQAKQKAAEYLDLAQRARAELANYRRRVDAERATLTQTANARLLMRILPVLDDFERAFETLPLELRNLTWIQGIAQIYRKLQVGVEAEGATPFASLLQSDGPLPDVSIHPKEDVIVLPYSSGTTGLPKGVMLTHYNLVANVAQMDGIDVTSGVELRPDDVVLAVLPFFHIYGMVLIMSFALYRGTTLVTMPRFDMERCLGLMQKHRVSYAYLVPPIVLGLAKHPLVDKFDLSSLRAILSGAAPLGDEIEDAVKQRLGCLVTQGYGMTEASPVTHFLAVRPEHDRKPGSVGPVIPNTECKVVDLATGEELGPRQEGELWIRGPQIMKGYLNNPTATAQTVDAEGWLHTGDIGYADEDGYFWIVDRAKELIKYKGLQVAPAELEAVLVSHPAVADAAVIGVPDEEAGELPKAFVVLKGQATAEEIMAYVAGQVAPYKKIRFVEFIPQIPKSATGKILRRVLKEGETARG